MVLAFFFKRTLVIKLVRDRSTFFLRSKMKAKPPPPPKKKKKKKSGRLLVFLQKLCPSLFFWMVWFLGFARFGRLFSDYDDWLSVDYC